VAEDLGIALDTWIGGEVVANSLGLIATLAVGACW
jgi:predicted MFS family arabinose efflux permease